VFETFVFANGANGAVVVEFASLGIGMGGDGNFIDSERGPDVPASKMHMLDSAMTSAVISAKTSKNKVMHISRSTETYLLT
jgi:hypothetical protein